VLTFLLDDTLSKPSVRLPRPLVDLIAPQTLECQHKLKFDLMRRLERLGMDTRTNENCGASLVDDDDDDDDDDFDDNVNVAREVPSRASLNCCRIN